MKHSLKELQAELVICTDENGSTFVVETIAEAQGVCFKCPKCFEANSGFKGTHSIICWSSKGGIDPAMRPGPGRWSLNGTSIDDLTLLAEVGGSHSVQLQSGCVWHGFVTNGSTHEP